MANSCNKSSSFVKVSYSPSQTKHTFCKVIWSRNVVSWESQVILSVLWEMLFNNKIFLHPHLLFFCSPVGMVSPVATLNPYPLSIQLLYFHHLVYYNNLNSFPVCLLTISTHAVVSQYPDPVTFPLPGYISPLFLFLSLCYIQPALPEINYGGNWLFVPALRSTMPNAYGCYLSREPVMGSIFFSLYVHSYVM